MKSIASLTVSTKSVDYISTIWPTRRWTSAHNTCQPQPYPDHYIINASGTRTSHSIIPNIIPESTTVKICCDVIFHRAVVDEEMRHLDTFSRPHLVVCLYTDIPTARRPRRSDLGMQCLFGSRREVGSWVSR